MKSNSKPKTPKKKISTISSSSSEKPWLMDSRTKMLRGMKKNKVDKEANKALTRVPVLKKNNKEAN